VVTTVILRNFGRNLGRPFGEISGETSQGGIEREMWHSKCQKHKY
jgi:hypothetical protein